MVRGKIHTNFSEVVGVRQIASAGRLFDGVKAWGGLCADDVS